MRPGAVLRPGPTLPAPTTRTLRRARSAWQISPQALTDLSCLSLDPGEGRNSWFQETASLLPDERGRWRSGVRWSGSPRQRASGGPTRYCFRWRQGHPDQGMSRYFSRQGRHSWIRCRGQGPLMNCQVFAPGWLCSSARPHPSLWAMSAPLRIYSRR